MKRIVLFSVAWMVSIGVWIAPLQAEDWPQYRGARLDGTTSEKIAKSWPSAGPKVVWKVPLKDGFSSFSTGAGKAFTLVTRAAEGVNRETVVALDVTSGKELWSYSVEVSKYDGGGDSGTDENKGGDGPRSTPAYADGKVYVLSLHLKLICLDANSGKPVWTRDLIQEHQGKDIHWQNAASPVLDGDLVFVGGGGAGQALMGVHRLTGKVIWKGEDDTITHATPVVATILGERQVIFFTQSGLVALKTIDGSLLWRYKFPFNVSTAASPVVSGDIVYCSAGYGVGSAAVKLTHPQQGWEVTELWRLKGNKIANHWSTPVVKDGFLYGMFSFKEYGAGPLKCVELATGKERWAQAGFGPGNVILVDGALLVLGDSGQVVLAKADPTQYSELGRFQALQGKCWSTPIVSNGRIFVRSTREAVALESSGTVSRR